MISNKVWFDALDFQKETRQYKELATALCEIAKAYNEIDPNGFNEVVAKVILSGKVEELRAPYVDGQVKSAGKLKLMWKMLEQAANKEFNGFALLVGNHKAKFGSWLGLDLSLLTFKGEVITLTGEATLKAAFTNQAVTDRQKRFIELVEQIEIARDELATMLPVNIPMIGNNGVFEVDFQDLVYNPTLIAIV